MEGEPRMEEQVEAVFPPEVEVLMALLADVQDDWTGFGCKLRIKTMINERLDLKPDENL